MNSGLGRDPLPAGRRGSRWRAGGVPRGAWRGVLAAGAIGAAVTVVLVAIPGPRFAYYAPAAGAADEAAAAVIAFLAAYLVAGRFRFSGQWCDLVLVGALAVQAISNLFFATIPAAFDVAPTSFSTWATAASGLLSGSLFAIAAFASDRTVVDRRRSISGLLGAAAAGLVAIVLFAVLAAPGLPGAFGGPLDPARADSVAIDAPAGFVAIRAASVAVLIAAAVGFARRSNRDRDRLLAWFAAGMTLAAFSRLNQVLFPAIVEDWITTGDMLRLAFYALLLLGALGEIRDYQRRAAAAAVFEERRRMARDLHDGLLQELAFISLEARRLARGGGEPSLGAMSEAAQRAIDESRGAITALTRTSEEHFASELENTARVLAARVGVRLRFEADPDIAIAPGQRDPLLRIAREAITNAIKHADPEEILLELSIDGGLTMRISDDGRGFVSTDPRTHRGLGLGSMRERAEVVGGALRVDSRPGQGTVVELSLPPAPA